MNIELLFLIENKVMILNLLLKEFFKLIINFI